MSPVFLLKGARREILFTLGTLGILMLMPLFAVIVVAQSGIAVVSETLAAVNPITHLVEIFDPDGNKIAEVELSTVWPANGYVSDEFGASEVWRHKLGLGTHTGIDIANPNGETGDPITPFMTGTILSIDNTDDSSCGKGVKIQHQHNIISQYCHLDYAIELEQGIEVSPGDLIGYMGSSGTSTGPHLHFATYVYGIPVNPRTFMVGEPSTQ